jgi:GTP-binding protein
MKRLPQVIILGFPNVGKSTLFNRLLGMKKSLVHSLPGMTRDPVSALCSVDEKTFILTDTGGLADPAGTPLGQAVSGKAWSVARKADLVLLLLDARRELLPGEEELWIELKKLGKSVLVVLNKVDSVNQEARTGDVYNRLGAESIVAISAEHKRNLEELERRLVEFFPAGVAEPVDLQPLKVAVIGRINVGKSSLINRLLGEEQLIVSDLPGTTRDSTDSWIRRNKKIFCLVDTAGIRRLSRARDEREHAGIIKAKKNIDRADVLCLVMDTQEFPTHQDVAVAHLAFESGKPLLLALNKWDLVPKTASAQLIRQAVYRRMPFVDYAPLLFTSARTGKGVVKILDTAEEVFEQSARKIETQRLNEFLAWMNKTHPPLSKAKKRIKIKYIVQKGVRPPRFILFAHSPAALLPAYERFFLQSLREKFGFWGSPMRLAVRKS